MSLYWMTIIMGAIAGAAGGALAVAIWMLKAQSKVANGAAALSNNAKAVQERRKYFILSALVGAAAGSIVGFYGVEAHVEPLKTLFSALGVGLIPGGLAKFIAGV